jgi:copper chaperone CopZ
MKTTILFALLALMTLGYRSSFAQVSNGKWQTVVIQTSAECGDCKTRIEEGLNYTKGVSFAELDLETKKVTVKYNAEKITLDEVKKAINKIGYHADDFKASQENILKLPACCQPGEMQNSGKQ